MKVAYILTSSGTDFFFEQTILSIYSLRQHNPNMDVVVIVDDKTAKTFNEKRNFYDFGIEPIVVTCPNDMTEKERSRYLKFELRSILKGDILYVDSDTIITDKLEDLSRQDGDVFAVIDKHTTKITTPVLEKIKKSKLDFPESFDYFNGGVWFTKDTPAAHKFFEDWKKLWLNYKTPTFCLDQPGLNYANIINKNIIKALDGTWNCQVFRNGLKYLASAKIIHYYAVNDINNPYVISNDFWFAKIRNNDCRIPDEIKEMLNEPKKLFPDISRIVFDENQIAVMDSFLFNYISKHYEKCQRLFSFLNKVAYHILKK